jgi:hypothetical protein
MKQLREFHSEDIKDCPLRFWCNRQIFKTLEIKCSLLKVSESSQEKITGSKLIINPRTGPVEHCYVFVNLDPQHEDFKEVEKIKQKLARMARVLLLEEAFMCGGTAQCTAPRPGEWYKKQPRCTFQWRYRIYTPGSTFSEPFLGNSTNYFSKVQTSAPFSSSLKLKKKANIATTISRRR